MASEQYDYDGPIPPELMDEPEGVEGWDNDLAWAFAYATETDASLGEALDALEIDGGGTGWRVRTDDDAEWALRKIAVATAELAELDAKAKRWAEKIQAWFEQAAKDPARTAEFFTAQVERYAMAERREHDRKSVRLPSGKFSTRQSADALEIVDEETLVSWARAFLPDAVRVREDVQVSTLRSLVSIVDIDDVYVWVDEETGEKRGLPPGTSVRRARMVPKVEVGE